MSLTKSSNICHFSSTLPITVLFHSTGESFDDWQIFDQGPGYFTTPENHEVGIEIKNINDDTLFVLIDDLTECQQITYLKLSENRNITNKGISFLPKLHSLTHLDLSACGLNNQGLPYLLELPKLQYLDLSYCNRITDKGVKSLQQLSHLSFLNVKGIPKLTTAGIKRLKRNGLTLKL